VSQEQSRRTGITTIITFLLLNIIWTAALNASADQHIISPDSDIVSDYNFEGPDIFGREIPFIVNLEINEVEGKNSSDVIIQLQRSDGSIIEIYEGKSDIKTTVNTQILTGSSTFLISVYQEGELYPVPSDLVEIDLRTEMELYVPIKLEGYVAANLLALILIVTDRTLRSWASIRRSRKGSPIIRKLRQEWNEVEKSISGGDPVDVNDLSTNSSSSSSMISKRRAWSVDEPEPQPEEGDQDIETAEAELDPLDELGEGDESGLQGKAELDQGVDTISDLWDQLGEGQKKRRGP
jgi:hypothetical protein